MDLSELPRGLVEFGGMTFDARGIVQVSGQAMKAQGGDYPEQIKGIPVNRQCQRIHFLHGTGWSTPEGVEIGAYVIHYADGQRRVLPLVYGHDVRDWYFFQSLPVTSREARLVWLGANQRTRADGAHLQLYVRSWENPAPDVEITSIDLVSAMTACAPFIIAITVNDLPVKGPDVQVEHARQEEQARAVSREVSQAVMQGHYEQALRRLEEKWKSDQAQFGPTNAHSLQTLRQLVDLTGCLADWARCVEFARRYTALSGDDPVVARDCAVAALLAGDERTYRDVCQRMVTRYAKTTDAIEAERAAKLCFLATNALADLGPALRLARMAVDSATNNLWFRLAQGMAEFRSGQAEAAIEWLEPALACNELHIATLAGYVASLAHHQLGASERARAALTNANARFDAFLQQGFVTGGGWEWWWFDPAASMALRLEAEKTVLGQPVWARPTVASLAATRQAWWARQREARASSGSSPTQPSPATLVGKAVPGAFKLALLDGGEFVLPDPKTTNVLLLDFWASWCGPCRQAMPVLAEIGRDYAGRGLRYVAVNLREKPDVIRRYLAAAGVAPTVALEAEGRMAAAFQVRAIPTMVLIDRKGLVAWVHEGSTPDLKPRLTEVVRGLLDRDRCVENLRVLGLASQLWAVDHGNVMPPDFHSMSNEVSSTQVLICPADTGRRAAADWGSLTTNNVTYEFLAPSVSVPASPGRRQRVVFHCPVHDNVVLLDGAVCSRPSPGAPDQLLRQDGNLYFGPPGATTDGRNPRRPDLGMVAEAARPAHPPLRRHLWRRSRPSCRRSGRSRSSSRIVTNA